MIVVAYSWDKSIDRVGIGCYTKFNFSTILKRSRLMSNVHRASYNWIIAPFGVTLQGRSLPALR